MIQFVTFGSNDMRRSAVFYDALSAELGGGRVAEFGDAIAWGGGDGSSLAILPPWDKAEARPGNGPMVALTATDRDMVDRVHRLALASGGQCEGLPGERGPGFYAAYFRDPDGNKLAVVKRG